MTKPAILRQNYFQHAVALFLVLVFQLVASADDLETWTDESGRFSVEASFQRVSDGKVVLTRRDGIEVAVPLEMLGRDSLVRLAKQLASMVPQAAVEEQVAKEAIVDPDRAVPFDAIVEKIAKTDFSGTQLQRQMAAEAVMREIQELVKSRECVALFRVEDVRIRSSKPYVLMHAVFDHGPLEGFEGGFPVLRVRDEYSLLISDTSKAAKINKDSMIEVKGQLFISKIPNAPSSSSGSEDTIRVAAVQRENVNIFFYLTKAKMQLVEADN